MTPRSFRALAALALLGAACTPVRVVLRDLEQTERLLEQTRALNGDRCAPVDFADAQSDAAFARLEFDQGNAARAQEHTQAAAKAAKAAYEASVTCGAADYDGDGIPDIVDQCPKEAEDADGVNDADGCPDLDPYADEDGDGYRNLDDDCPKEAEDFDGFKDGDGCPDPDNDKDGVPDAQDRCANQAEDIDQWADADGCPDWDNDADGIEDLDDSCPDAPGTRATKGCPEGDKDSDGVLDSVDKCPDQPEDDDGVDDGDGCPDP